MTSFKNWYIYFNQYFTYFIYFTGSITIIEVLSNKNTDGKIQIGLISLMLFWFKSQRTQGNIQYCLISSHVVYHHILTDGREDIDIPMCKRPIIQQNESFFNKTFGQNLTNKNDLMFLQCYSAKSVKMFTFTVTIWRK